MIRVDDPILLLRREHDEALEVLDRLQDALNNPSAPKELASIRRAVAFLDEDVRAHNEREEECLFPALERVLTPAGPTEVMRSEHREFWRRLSALKAAVLTPPLLPNSTREIGFLTIDLLRSHIQKENGILFPMAQAVLTPDDLFRVARKMEDLIEAREELAATPWAV